MESIDLDIQNYNLQDLYHLFNIEDNILDVESLKKAKQIALKTHPDKSKLEPKYFLFFSNAYKKLYSIYEFQNKSTNKNLNYRDNDNTDHHEILNELFEKNKKLKDPNHFNKWFNKQFEKHKSNNENDVGYGEWLKTNEGIYHTSAVFQTSLHEEFEKQKGQMKSLSVYNGITDSFASNLGGSILGKMDDFSSGMFDGGGLHYQDLRKAHLETVIPITKDDFNKIPKFGSTQEYKIFRDQQNINPLCEKESLDKLRYTQQQLDEDSANLAFYYAQQNEEALKQNDKFWAELKHLTNG